MTQRPLVPVFAATLFLSAFLIFTVQPMAGKMMLPLLGGSPSVWNTAMVFFQGMLLAGYAYAHFIARHFSLKAQAVMHLILLAGFAMFLPLALPDGVSPPDESGQSVWQLVTMFTCLGGPFFVLTASAPLFQHWFASSGHEDAENPYFLYAVSNAGSMAALLSYPVLIEPFLTLSGQQMVWAGGYALLALFVASCAFMVRGGEKPLAAFSSLQADAPDWKTRAFWVLLAFIPSSLMLGVTTLITTDIASAPFLWIVPLALYLATFIVAFSRAGDNVLPVVRELAAYGLCFVALAFMIANFATMMVPLMLIHLAAFFLCALYCHAQLAAWRPAPAHLTQYFLLISFGGVLGGAFNALAAPHLFTMPLEYPLVMALVGLLLWREAASAPAIFTKFNMIDDRRKPQKLLALDIITIALGLGGFVYIACTDDGTMRIIGAVGIFLYLIMLASNRRVFAVTGAAALLLFAPGVYDYGQNILHMQRNYFGVLKVAQKDNAHLFYHGTTLHGSQWLGEDKPTPTSYYSPSGPAGDVFKNLSRHKGEQYVAALGMGVGSIACYSAPQRHFDFYEIDRDVAATAENPNYFTYLSGCGSDYSVILGDARSKIADAAANRYDLIFVDTFSSDNIPVHILTREAITLYLQKLKPQGVIAINISNRYLDLRPVIQAIADDLSIPVFFKKNKPERTKGEVSSLHSASVYAVLGRDTRDIAYFVESYGWSPYTGEKKVRAWTDDYANILSSMVSEQ